MHEGPPETAGWAGESALTTVGRDGSELASARISPRQQVARVLAAGVIESLDGGDVSGARAAAKALLAFVEELAQTWVETRASSVESRRKP